MRRDKVIEVEEGSIRLIPEKSQTFGSTETCTNSVEFILHLGAVSGGKTAGLLRIKEESITPNSFTTDALSVATLFGSAQVINDTNDKPRQVRVPEGLANIVTLSTTSYEICLYLAAQVTGFDSPTGLHTTTGTPFVTYIIAEATGSSASIPRLSITEIRGGKSIETIFQQDGDDWTTSSGNGLRTELLSITTDGGDRVETRELRNPDTSLAERRVTKIRPYSFGAKIIEETLGSGTDLITTTYTWYDNAGTDGMVLGELKSRQTSTGNWETWTYDNSGRRLKRVSQFLSSTFNSADGLNRVTEWIYGTVADLDGDDADEELETEIEYLLGEEFSRRHRLKLSGTGGIGEATWKEERTIVTTVVGAAWDASTNLVTVTYTGQEGQFLGRTLWHQNPDSTVMRLEVNSLAAGGREWITSEGVLQLDDSILGRRTVVTEDELGRELTRDIYEDNHLIESITVLARDELGRPTLISYLDGTEEIRDYACCGLNLLQRRDGITTSYERDDLGRITRETTAGLATTYTYDAAGRQLQVSRIDANDTPHPVQNHAYAVSGRLLSTTDALSRTTLYEEAQLLGGLIQRTTIHPDASEEIELTHPDGSLASIRGDAALWRDYAYGVDAGGAYEQEFLPRGDEGASPSSQWVRRYRDQAGRLIRILHPDDAEETYAYNAKGQLVSHSDPDGVQTLYAYDDRGRRTVTALDLNQNGAIDYSGTDRITRATTYYATRGSATVRRTTIEAWEADSEDAPTTFTVQEIAVDSHDQWSTTRGLTTHTITSYDGLGGRTEATTLPDNATHTRTYAAGRLTAEVHKDGNTVTLSETTYAYDAFGRLGTQTIIGIGATTYTYYPDDQIASVTTPDPDTTKTGEGYEPQTTSYTYNTRGWPSKLTHPDGAETHTTYYPTGQPKRTWGARAYRMEYSYDPQGRVKTLTTWQDFAGTSGAAVTTWNYDSQRGWLTGKRYQDNQGPDYTYTEAGRLATRTWARGVVTTYAYNDAGDLGSVIYSDSTPSVVNTYDRLGRPLTTADAAGLLTRDYASGRLESESYTGSGLLAGQSITRTFDDLGRLSGLSADAVASLAYGYDNASRLATVAQGGFTATYAYADPLGLVASVVVRNGATERATQLRTADRLGRIDRVDTVGNGALLHARRDYTYDNANQRTLVEHEDTRRWAYGYDALGQVISAEKRLAGDAPLPGYAFGYDFDDIGNRLSTTTNGSTAGYTADLLNRYAQRDVPGVVDVRGTASAGVTVLVNDGPTARAGADFYRAMSVDNTTDPVNEEIKVQAVDLGPPTLVATETRDAFVAKTPESYTYDDDGNLTSDGRWTYAWDGENRLIALETVGPVALTMPDLKRRLEFAYDGQSRRIGKIVKAWNETTSQWETETHLRFIYDGWNLLAEYDALDGDALVRTHMWGLDLSESMQGAGGVGGLLWTHADTATYAPGYDANGNIIAWIDLADGTLAGEREYGAFGEPVAVTGLGGALPFGFSTKYRDELTELYYYGFRYYNPSTGRWLSRDPIEELEVGSLNLYGMIDNDPIGFVDILGLQKNAAGNSRADGRHPNTGSLIDSALDAVLGSAFYRCYLLDLTKEDLDEINAVLESQIALLDTDIAQDYFSGLPQSAALKFLAINAAARKLASSIPQGRPGPFGIPTVQSAAAKALNANKILVPLRREIAKASLRMVGRGGVKVWGRIGSKFLPLVGWASLAYEAAKACHCASVTDDGDFTENEKFIGQ